MLANGFAYERDPILRPLENIECRDAILDIKRGSRSDDMVSLTIETRAPAKSGICPVVPPAGVGPVSGDSQLPCGVVPA